MAIRSFNSGKKRVLVCEDDEMIINVICYKLEKDGYDIDKALDGRQAGDKIRNNVYDILIVDMMMPYMTGLEITSMVRTELMQNTPIIILSKIGIEETILKAFELGADDYIVKPFSPNELSVRVKKLLTLKG
jgi:DNA-binding response OmpR family regulator